MDAFSYGLSNCDNDFFEGQGVLPLDYAFYDSLGAELESAQYTVTKPGLYYMTVQLSIGWVSLYRTVKNFKLSGQSSFVLIFLGCSR